MALIAKVVLMPLHVLAARRANGPGGAGGWVFLAVIAVLLVDTARRTAPPA